MSSGDVSVLFASPNTEVTGVQQRSHVGVNLNPVLMLAQPAFHCSSGIVHGDVDGAAAGLPTCSF